MEIIPELRVIIRKSESDVDVSKYNKILEKRERELCWRNRIEHRSAEKYKQSQFNLKEGIPDA
jgi:hypothetical protein